MGQAGGRVGGVELEGQNTPEPRTSSSAALRPASASSLTPRAGLLPTCQCPLADRSREINDNRQ